MADISAEIAAFKNAVYGEDVRDAMVSLANKLNNIYEEAMSILELESITTTFVWTSRLYGTATRMLSYPVYVKAGAKLLYKSSGANGIRILYHIYSDLLLPHIIIKNISGGAYSGDVYNSSTLNPSADTEYTIQYAGWIILEVYTSTGTTTIDDVAAIKITQNLSKSTNLLYDSQYKNIEKEYDTVPLGLLVRNQNLGNYRFKTFPIYVNGSSIFFHKYIGNNDIQFRGYIKIYNSYDKAIDAYYRDDYSLYDADITYSSGLSNATNDAICYFDTIGTGYFIFLGYARNSQNLNVGNNYTGKIYQRYNNTLLLDKIAIDRLEKNTDISSFKNRLIEYENLILNASIRSYKKGAPSGTPTIFKLVFFSDLHNTVGNLKNIIEFNDIYSDYVDDCICTGDMIYNRSSPTAMDNWNAIEGSENILQVMGNHEYWKEGASTWSGTDLYEPSEIYDMFWSDKISNWNLTSHSDKNTYYYKDYQSSKIRLIVLDGVLISKDDTAQISFLTSALTSALSQQYAVIIAQHYAARNPVKVNCNFTAIDGNPATENPWSPTTAYHNLVNNFINNNGEFICWLCGHGHCDYIHYNSDYPNQLFIQITNGGLNNSNGDQNRVVSSETQNAFDYLCVDTFSHIVKIVRIGSQNDVYLRSRKALTINYKTFEILSQI